MSFIEEYESVRDFDLDEELAAMRREREAYEMEQQAKETKEREDFMRSEIVKFEMEFGPLGMESASLTERYRFMCQESIAIYKDITEANKPKPKPVPAVIAPVLKNYTKTKKPEVALTDYKDFVSKKESKAKAAIEAEFLGNFGGQNDSEGFVSKKTDAKLFRTEKKILKQLSTPAPSVSLAPAPFTPVVERKMNIAVVPTPVQTDPTPVPTPVQTVPTPVPTPVPTQSEDGWETVTKRKTPPQPVLQVRPTRMCQSIMNKTTCKYGKNCKFAHKVEELERVPCKFDQCKYSAPLKPGWYTGTCERWHNGECSESYASRLGLAKNPKAPWAH